MSTEVANRPRQIQSDRTITAALVRLVQMDGPLTTHAIANALRKPASDVQRILLYAAQCGRVRRLSPGTPGRDGQPAVWAPADQEGGRLRNMHVFHGIKSAAEGER